MSSNALTIAVGLAFVLIGLVFVPIAIRRLRRDIASRSWPAIDAELVAVEAVTTVQQLPYADDGATQRTSHACRLTFRYRFEEETYTALYAVAAASRAQAERKTAAYCVGELHPAFIDPEEPTHLILEHTPPYAGLLWLLPGLAFAAFGLLVIAVA